MTPKIDLVQDTTKHEKKQHSTSYLHLIGSNSYKSENWMDNPRRRKNYDRAIWTLNMSSHLLQQCSCHYSIMAFLMCTDRDMCTLSVFCAVKLPLIKVIWLKWVGWRIIGATGDLMARIIGDVLISNVHSQNMTTTNSHKGHPSHNNSSRVDFTNNQFYGGPL